MRHNLSLNKCFKKVDKERSQSIGKGSLWCIDPEIRQSLIQALKKTPYHPHSNVFNTAPAAPQAYQSTSGPPLWPGRTFFKRNGALLQYPDIDAATAMMLLNTPPEIQAGFPPGVIQNGKWVLSRGLFPGVRPLPVTPIGMTAAVRNGLPGCRLRTESKPGATPRWSAGTPKRTTPTAAPRPPPPAAPRQPVSAPRPPRPTSPTGSPPRDPEGSEGSCPSRESHSEPEEDGRPRGPREAPGDGCPAHKKRPPAAKTRKVPSDTLPLKKRRTEKPPESDDEEMKEAAGSLLHLAGIRSCLNNITNRTAKGQKEQKETAKN